MYRDGVRNPISEAAAQQEPLCIDRQRRYVFGREWSFGPRGLGGQLCFEPLRGLLWSGLLPDRSIRNGIHLFLDKLGRCVMIYAGGQCFSISFSWLGGLAAVEDLVMRSFAR